MTAWLFIHARNHQGCISIRPNLRSDSMKNDYEFNVITIELVMKALFWEFNYYCSRRSVTMKFFTDRRYIDR